MLQPGLAPGHTIALKVDGEDGKDVNTVDDTTIELMKISSDWLLPLWNNPCYAFLEMRVVDWVGDHR